MKTKTKQTKTTKTTTKTKVPKINPQEIKASLEELLRLQVENNLRIKSTLDSQNKAITEITDITDNNFTRAANRFINNEQKASRQQELTRALATAVNSIGESSRERHKTVVKQVEYNRDQISNLFTRYSDIRNDVEYIKNSVIFFSVLSFVALVIAIFG